MKTQKLKREPTHPAIQRPMFYLARRDRPATTPPFFQAAAPHVQLATAATPIIQRQDTAEKDTAQESSAKKAEKDPLVEGLKITGARLLKEPKFKAWYKPRLSLLKQNLWEERPSEEKAALITFGGVNLALAGLVFALNPEMRELLSGANIGTPLGWLPYSPVEGFKYKLPKPGESQYGFSGEFTLNPYLGLLRDRYPNFPLSGAKFGLDTAYTPGQGLSLTGGKFGLEFLGGGLKAEGKSFTKISPYPLLIPGADPLAPPSTLMQSVPGLPPLHTGPGFQVMLSADLYKLFPKLAHIF
ncbi:MAG: hypothetical protein F6K00_18755 [Leptolyngbya sp. SIOISBB]|nr:hypothetical protein [Leptolyngbya sp. SIOISBB]